VNGIVLRHLSYAKLGLNPCKVPGYSRPSLPSRARIASTSLSTLLLCATPLPPTTPCTQHIVSIGVHPTRRDHSDTSPDFGLYRS
jgi:hypothetical protein